MPPDVALTLEVTPSLVLIISAPDAVTPKLQVLFPEVEVIIISSVA